MRTLVWGALHLLCGSEATLLSIYNRYDEPPIELFPLNQHTPLNGSPARPPPPQIPKDSKIFIGLSSFRDGERCGNTIFSAFKSAAEPFRLRFGVVDQVFDEDVACLDAYCRLAKKAWPHTDKCAFESQITISKQPALKSRGPNVARHIQQSLVQDEDFCLQLDAHSIFSKNWDTHMTMEWQRANNEMAVLSTYPHAHRPEYIGPDGENRGPDQFPHLCSTIRGSKGCVRTEGASMLLEASTPQLTALWGAGLSFSKCHSERRVRIDPKMLWLFDGEEFLRASHLWTHGYDMYSPSISVIYHNYSATPSRFESLNVDFMIRQYEETQGVNRYKQAVGLPFYGLVDTADLGLYKYGRVRSLEDYLSFAGIDLKTSNDRSSCNQLYWQPYTNPKPVEELIHGWLQDRSDEFFLNQTAAQVIDNHVVASNSNHFRQDKFQRVGNNIQVHQSISKRMIPYHLHFMISMLALLVGLVVFVVYVNHRKVKRQLKKLLVQ